LDQEGEGGGLNLGRIIAALLRFKWLIIASFGLGIAGAYVAYRSIQPEYRVDGAIWVTIDERAVMPGGPIAQSGLLQQTAWIDLLRSYAVLDPVTLQERLYIRVSDDYRHLFQDFELGPRFRPGRYTLEVTENRRQWNLFTEEGVQIAAGTPGDSICLEMCGFRWAPPASALLPEMDFNFQVIRPRDASRSLSEQLMARMDRQGNFIRMTYTGTNPERIASILQSVMEQHVEVAAELKRGKLVELTVILEEQLASVRQELEDAENQLESFRVQTITLPAEESAPISAGLDQTRGPVFNEYFNRRLELDAIIRDRARLAAVLDSIPANGVRVESFELIPAVQQSSQLQGALQELTTRRATLRTFLQDFTEDYPPIQDLQGEIRELEQVSLPSLTRSLIAELESRELDLRGTLDERSAELQEIPPRAIEEARLQRRVAIADRLYVDLRNRFEAARLASASSIPDIRILDDTRVPSVPSSDQRIPRAGMVFLAFLGAGLAAALLMDRADPRFRYITDVSDDLGIEILGVVPRLRTGRKDNSHAVFEAFRDIRMRTEFAHGTTRPIVLSVTSPDTDEGKTFVSGNLAISFAQLGYQTLIIDGDTRRGDLHELFDVRRKPGLIDLLEARVRNSLIKSTSYDNLDFLPSGSRRAASPELLSSGRMQQALAALKPRYEVIIMDSPPLSAGSDAFVLGAHAGNVILVMRSGATDKDLAKGKMETFYRLPVRILGGVLNDIDESDATVGYYRHYTYYLPEYIPGAEEDEDEEGGARTFTAEAHTRPTEGE
jgi:capsular exopolysaccharide synthesis family protein